MTERQSLPHGHRPSCDVSAFSSFDDAVYRIETSFEQSEHVRSIHANVIFQYHHPSSGNGIEQRSKKLNARLCTESKTKRGNKIVVAKTLVRSTHADKVLCFDEAL
jgi:hypothetical protein